MSETETEIKTRKEAFATIPSDQRFTWTLKPLPGRLLLAETAGRSLIAMKDVLETIGSVMGERQVVGLLDASIGEDGALSFDLVVMPENEPKSPVDTTSTPAQNQE